MNLSRCREISVEITLRTRLLTKHSRRDQVHGSAIYRGITTGLNDAFIIDNQTKEALVAEDPKSAEIIKPMLRGRDIRRYRAQWKGLWLIYSHSGTFENDYPAIREHLLSHRDRLSKRRGGANQRTGRVPYEWWQLQVDYYNSGAYRRFAGEKLFWMDMSPEGRFAYSNNELYCNDKGFIMTGASLKYLCAVLNSTLIAWLMRSTALTTGMGLLQWKKFAVERIPIPRLTSADQQEFIHTFDRILQMKDEDQASDTSETESEIDRKVYQLYGLTPGEISQVEESL